jgi:two-component system, sensor histidine kinase LadS
VKKTILSLFSLLYFTTINADVLRHSNITYTSKSYLNQDTTLITAQQLNQLGFTKGVVNVNLQLPRTGDYDNKYVKIDFPFIDSLTVNSAGIELYKFGDAFVFNDRIIKHKAFIFPLTRLMVYNGIHLTVYCNGEYTRVPVKIGALHELLQTTTLNLVLGLYYGVIFFAMFLSLFLLYTLREKTYVWYTLFLLATFLFQFSTEGLAFQYLWPNNPWWGNHVIPFTGSLALLVLVLFTKEIFNSTQTKTLGYLYNFIGGMLVLFCVFSLLGNPYYSISLVGASVASIFINIFLLGIGIYNLIKKHSQAYYYSWAFGVLIVSIIVSQLKYNGIIPINIITDNVLMIGSAVEILLLSLGLTMKISYFKNKEQEAQQALLLQLQKQTLAQQKANEELEQKVNERTEDLKIKTEELAEINAEHLQSLTYASYIQSSVLPSLSIIKEKLPNSFVYYAPRDIVSGDFYWYYDVKTSGENSVNLQVICAVDCTGHGVPGAFMSLIGNNLLNLTIKAEDVNSPADVIAFINKNLAKSFNRKDNTKVINDGMDMAVCAYQPSTKTLYYSGANRPLYIVKKNTLELTEIKATKVAVGGYTPLTQTWNNEQISLDEGDTFYMTSDGYADQFGGDKNKKMMTKRLKEFLVEINPLPMHEQRNQLETYFHAWKGPQQQVDDVMIIGVRV